MKAGTRLATVKRVLLIGMSGTGKSSGINVLTALGHKAAGTDDGWCEPSPDGRQRRRQDAIGELLAADEAGMIFVAGCEENQVVFHPRFDVIILLSAPAEVLTERLASRTANSYGKPPPSPPAFVTTRGTSDRACAWPPITRSGPRFRSPMSSAQCCASRACDPKPG